MLFERKIKISMEVKNCFLRNLYFASKSKLLSLYYALSLLDYINLYFLDRQNEDNHCIHLAY